MHKSTLLSLALGSLAPVAVADFPASDCLWYQQPALVRDMDIPWAEGRTPSGNKQGKQTGDAWSSQSLPVGNGRVGGTIFGGDHRERVNLNEVSLWTGGPNLPNNGNGYAYGPTTGADGFGSYQPFGNLFIEFDGVKGEQTENYTRSLNLKEGVAAVDFTNAGVHHERECFVSRPDNVLVYTAKVDKPGALTANIGITPYHDVSYSKAGNNTLVMSGTLANGEKFEGRVMVRTHGGSATVQGGSKSVKVSYEGGGDNQYPKFDAKGIPYIAVKGADSVEIYVSLATNYKEDYKANWKGKDPAARNEKILAKVAGKKLEDIRKAHVEDHAALYNRMTINLGESPADVAKLPTDARIERYKNNHNDPQLEALVYQYGRYVLIAGSRPGNLPLTLQGIWNDKVHAPWACDYHNNINLQMCYWGAEVANLSECHTTFIDFMKAMEEPLHEMTQKEFGSDKKGWTTRISQNIWGGGGWVKWNPPVNAWYALHIWDHYQFTQDKKFLAKVGYPLLKSICQFWETSLKEVGQDGQGLMTENGKKPLTVAEHPELKGIKKGSLVSPNGWSHEQGPVEDCCMHDQQLIWELFDSTAKAARELGADAAWAKGLIAKRDRLVGNKVAPGGYLQEWVVDRPNMVSGHRHTSHLIGVFPGTTISKAKTPELAAAAEKSLELRGMSGDNRRSWTWPWRTALWARFGNREKAYEMVSGYIQYNMLDNMFGNHPPMQMDGTYGMTGAMSEIFIQSHAGRIELLPSLPKEWPNGSIKGIRARGNITVDMTWKDGKVTDYKLTTTSEKPKPVKLVVNGKTEKITPAVVAPAK